ncbi:MAG: DUF1343 domain-containing protein [Bacteroidales bacterium]
MVLTGLDIISEKFPSAFYGKRIGVLCHAPSITRRYKHITEIIAERKECTLSAIFGPQHGIYGQTQDNMIEWESNEHPVFKVPLFSLYGKFRKPSPQMFQGIDLLLIDLQDAGTRVYTYIWTIKLCIEACRESGIPVYVLDRPNPIGKLPFDGPILKKEFFTFVGGASIPLCHRMTIGEMSLWIKEKYYPSCDLNIIWMKGWHRHSLYSETGLPWVLPSPNLPTPGSAIVYPGTVLIEGLNISEGRGTTIPFELFGAPFIDAEKLKKNLLDRNIPGCTFRIHNFIPTFNKFCGEKCNGLQIHVTEPEEYFPVAAAMEIISAIIETSPENSLHFNHPPYEYEKKLIPFDILSGDSGMRKAILNHVPVSVERERWNREIGNFRKEFGKFSAYPE